MEDQLVALSPTGVALAHNDLGIWCRRKVIALGQELAEQRRHMREAKRMLWRYNGWNAAIARTRKRMIYYAKIQAACRLGYLVIPNFNVDVIAVRVNHQHLKRGEGGVGQHVATPGVLPPGEGWYVDDALQGRTVTRQIKDYEGKPKTVTEFHPESFDTQLDFPATMIKPVVLDATQQAMAHKLFDRIGIVRGTSKSDPIVVGQIIDPKTTSTWGRRQYPKCVSFFVAWWLNPEDL